MSQAQQQAPAPQSASRGNQADRIELPGENLTLEETLRVMDVARELRDQRQTAEEMFRRDDIRTALRDKLMRTAQVSGDRVTEAELDAAIDQYLATIHTYRDPAPSLQTFLARCWIRRTEILTTAAAIAAAVGTAFYFFF